MPGPTIAALHAELAERRTSATELARRALAAIRAAAGLNAFLSVAEESALEAAAASDERYRAGAPLSEIDGLPIAVKDNIAVLGQPMTCGSRILTGYVPPYEATAAARLRAAGAVLIGKTNCDEFAMGSSNENSAFGPVANPAAPGRVPGGSSGGSAAAVAAGLVPAALGSDTGGSVRQPAALCGLVGVRPTYGRISRYGLTVFASSLDQIGPLAGDCAGAARLIEIMAGPDGLDSTALAEPCPPLVAACRPEVAGLTIGVPRSLEGGAGVDPEVAERTEAALARLTAAGARIIEVDLPHDRYAVAAYYLIATAEASSNLARYDGLRYGLRVEGGPTLAGTYRATRSAGFGAEVKRRIMLGTYALSAGYYEAYYRKAQAVRSLIRRDFAAAFATCDAICHPTSPTPAFPLGERIRDPLAMYLSDVFTIAGPLAGLPCLSVPAGRTRAGLPVGFHVTAPAGAEPLLFRVGCAAGMFAEGGR